MNQPIKPERLAFIKSQADFGALMDPKQAKDLLNEIERLKALSVTNIMLAVVPGDGEGCEIYAKSVEDVNKLLTKMCDHRDALQDFLSKATVCLSELMNDMVEASPHRWHAAKRAAKQFLKDEEASRREPRR